MELEWLHQLAEKIRILNLWIQSQTLYLTFRLLPISLWCAGFCLFCFFMDKDVLKER
jgi:2-iminoacetate synthase ThiH